ncbi:hypothetical protein [Rhizobium miluonense]|uniref:Uncharacterized protein n=1 Tax=Rhizobium miluonense TaxID=411945 RepID=A0A1C3WTT3_9HYPH|nr:hypothetical protein [Rhizobium miluonense]SCB43360.1 hypothetical protein GA0061102_10405 [Rhizobium miluonense]
MRVATCIAFSVLAFPALADDTFIVDKQPQGGDIRFWDVRIVSKIDNLRIDHVDVNRGCQHGGGVPLPVSLKFGESIFAGTYYCDPIEVVLDTPAGAQTAEFEPSGSSGLIAQKYNLPSALMLANGVADDNWSVVITSLNDSVTIKSVTVNRGNCRYTARLTMPELPNNESTLTYGERFAVGSFECNPLSVTVDTDKGLSEFSWDH